MARFFVLPVLLAVVASVGSAGDGKSGTAWKPFVPADVYVELTKRSILAIEETAKSDAKNAVGRVHAEATILAGYTLAVANAKDAEVSRVRGAAFVAARHAKDKAVQPLAKFGDMVKAGSILAPADVAMLKPRGASLDDLMEIFRNKAKGGEGIHLELQYHPKLKNTNGIESFLGALSAKKLSDENMDKVAKELPILAYRVAVVGAITNEYAPEKEAPKWRELSIQMRDASLALADAAKKKNADGIHKAAASLENSCTECHRAFKMK
ncbi:MAG: cytochrome c [Planctomycetes bacterium]|nr:cytochrome c [Planctomycetota bacterium]